MSPGPLSIQEQQSVLKQPQENTRKASDRQLGKMLPETRQLVDDFYASYNTDLARMMEDDKFLWND